MLKKIGLSVIALTSLFANIGTINVEVDMGSPKNFFEQVGNKKCIGFLYNSSDKKFDALRLADENVAFSMSGMHVGDSTFDSKISKGALIPVNPNVSNKTYNGCTNSDWKFESFGPGIVIYSGKNIRMNRGWLYTNEFAKYLNLNILFNINDAVAKTSDFNEIRTNPKSLADYTIVFELVNKFNKNSFIMTWDKNLHDKKQAILKKLYNFKDLLNQAIPKSNEKTFFENKVDQIISLINYADNLYNKLVSTKVTLVYADMNTDFSWEYWGWFRWYANNSFSFANKTDPGANNIPLSQLKTMRLIDLPNYSDYKLVASGGNIYLVNTSWEYWVGYWEDYESRSCSNMDFSNSNFLANCTVKISRQALENEIFNIAETNVARIDNAIDSWKSELQNWDESLGEKLGINRINMIISGTLMTKNINAVFTNNNDLTYNFFQKIQTWRYILSYRYLYSLNTLREFERMFYFSQFKNSYAEPNALLPAQLVQQVNKANENNSKVSSNTNNITQNNFLQNISTISNVITSPNGNGSLNISSVKATGSTKVETSGAANIQDVVQKGLTVIYVDDSHTGILNKTDSDSLMNKIAFAGALKNTDDITNFFKYGFVFMNINPSNNSIKEIITPQIQQVNQLTETVKTYSLPVEGFTGGYYFCKTNNGYFDYSHSPLDTDCSKTQNLKYRFSKNDNNSEYFVLTTPKEMGLIYQGIKAIVNTAYPNLKFNPVYSNTLEIIHHFAIDKNYSFDKVADILDGTTQSTLNPLVFMPYKADMVLKQHYIPDFYEVTFTPKTVTCFNPDTNQTQNITVYQSKKELLAQNLNTYCEVDINENSKPADAFVIQNISPSQNGVTEGNSIFSYAGSSKILNFNKSLAFKIPINGYLAKSDQSDISGYLIEFAPELYLNGSGTKDLNAVQYVINCNAIESPVEAGFSILSNPNNLSKFPGILTFDEAQYYNQFKSDKTNPYIPLIQPEQTALVTELNKANVPSFGDAAKSEYNFYELLFGKGYDRWLYIQSFSEDSNKVSDGIYYEVEQSDGNYKISKSVYDTDIPNINGTCSSVLGSGWIKVPANNDNTNNDNNNTNNDNNNTNTGNNNNIQYTYDE